MKSWQASGEIPAIEISLIWGAFTLLYLHVLRSLRCIGGRRLLLLLGAALLGRLLLAFCPIMLTGDVARYLWEGRVMRSGLNPYLYPPNALELAALRDANWAAVEYPRLGAIYPPAAQFFLSIFGVAADSWKLFLVAAEAGGVYLLWRLALVVGAPAASILVYVYLPLPLLEVALSGHLEGLLLPLLAGLWLSGELLLRRGQDSSSGLLLLTALLAAAGIAVKYVAALPVVVLAGCGLTRLSRRQLLGLGGSCCFFLALIFGPLLDPTLGVFDSLGTYLLHWRSNDSALHLIGAMAGVDWERLETFRSVKLVLAAAFGGFVLLLLMGRMDFLRATAYSAAVLLLLGSTFHPWYGLWFAPLLCVVHSRSLLLLCLSLPLAYADRLYELNELPVWIKLIEFVPVYILLALELRSWRRAENEPFGDSPVQVKEGAGNRLKD